MARFRHAALSASAIVFALALGSCTGIQNEPLEEEALYLDRYERAEEARARQAFGEIYDTMVPIRGAKTPSPLPQSQAATLSPEALEAAFDYAASRNTSAMLVLQGGNVIRSEYYGDTAPESLLVAKSLAKPLGVIAIGRAIEQGFIQSLDQPASDFFTEWKGTPKEAILIRHLLDMRSGLKRQSRYSGPEDVMRRAYLHPRHDEIILSDYPLTHTPGTRYDYSNANSELVAPLIERATGERYEAWVSAQVLEPLKAGGGEIWLNRPGGTAHAGCCMSLPAATWIKLALLIMSDGAWEGEQLLPPGFVTQMKAPTAQNPYTGMGIYNGQTYTRYRGAQNPDQGGGTLHSAPYDADDLVLFDGNGNQVIYMIPSQGLLIARFGNWPNPKSDWDNAYLPNLLLGSMQR